MESFADIEIPSVENVLNEQKRLQILRESDNEQKQEEYERKGKLFADAYKTKMINAILDAINDLKKGSNKFSVKLNVNFKEKLTIDGFTIDFHIVHYGGKPIFEVQESSKSLTLNWSKRTPNPLFAGLFKELQTFMLQKGYYLLDLSDPSKSHFCVINLYLGKPTWYDNAKLLWHGYNHI